jgi:predicted dehydrogenase
MKSILIIGCGSIGERHLRCFKSTGRTRVAACDSNATLLQRMAETYAVDTFADLDTALAAKPFDAAVICTPAQTHLPIAHAGLAKGLSLLIEKPLSVSLEGTAGFAAEVTRANVYAAVAYVYHFMPCVQAARDYLRTGALGRPLQVNVIAGQHFPTFRPAYRDIYYRAHSTGGGAIQDALTHLFNAVEWMLDLPTSRIYCDAAHQSLEGVDVEDTVAASARNGGAIVTYALNQFQAPNETSIQMHCEGGSLAVEVHQQRWKVFPRGATEWEIHDAPVPERDWLFTAQAHAFLDGLEGQQTKLCTIEEAIQTLKVNIAALESAASGSAVAIQ